MLDNSAPPSTSGSGSRRSYSRARSLVEGISVATSRKAPVAKTIAAMASGVTALTDLSTGARVSRTGPGGRVRAMRSSDSASSASAATKGTRKYVTR